MLQIAAAIAILASAVWFILRPQVGLQRSVGAEFASAFHRGDLVGQSAELTAGLIELHFRMADATVVIEAPARFRIEDAKTLRMDSGRVTAHVLDGRQGLRVLTPHTHVLDLGTRFEVHVFEGRVEAGSAGAAKHELLGTNQALRFATAARGARSRANRQLEPQEPIHDRAPPPERSHG